MGECGARPRDLWLHFLRRLSFDDFDEKPRAEQQQMCAGLVRLYGAINNYDSSPYKDFLWQSLTSIAEFERKLIIKRREDITRNSQVVW